MALLPIRKYPDPILKTPTTEVSLFNERLHVLLDDMRETMYIANGVGLAAPQIGESLRIAVIDVSDARNEPLELINPKILATVGDVSSEEGCLSIPDYRDTITRYRSISVEAQNRQGETFQVAADGLLSICMQHEIDHLDGVLFVDRMSRLKRELFKRWHKKHAAQES